MSLLFIFAAGFVGGFLMLSGVIVVIGLIHYQTHASDKDLFFRDMQRHVAFDPFSSEFVYQKS